MDPLSTSLALAAIFGGNLLSGRGRNRRERNAYNADRTRWDRDEQRRSARAQLAMAMLRGFGLGGTVNPGIQKPQPYPDYEGGDWTETLGSTLSGAGTGYLSSLVGGDPSTFAMQTAFSPTPEGSFVPPGPTPNPFSPVYGARSSDEPVSAPLLSELWWQEDVK